MQVVPLTSQEKPESLLTAEDLINMLRLSRAVVYQMLASGEIPSLRIHGRLYRIRRSDLDAWLEKRRQGGA